MTTALPRALVASPAPPNKPRVLVVAPLYHSARGGLGQQAKLVTEGLADEGLELIVATRAMKGLPAIPYHPKVRIARLRNPRPRLHNYDRASIETLIVSLTFSFGLLRLIWRLRRGFELAHFHGASLPLILALPLLKLLGKPTVALVAGTDQGFEAGDLKRRYGPLGWLLAWWLSKVDGYIALSPQVSRALQGEGYAPERIASIPNLVETERFRPARAGERAATRAALGEPDDARVTLSVGRLVPLKGIATLLSAFAEAAPRVRRARLWVVGDGPERARLERLAAELGIAERVRFLGFREDIPALLAAADLFVLPSTHEGSPNALLEAMSCGLPCLASDIPGCRDNLPPDAGWLVPTGDPQALAGALTTLLIDATQRELMGEAGRAHILRGHRRAEVLRRTRRLYDFALGGEPLPEALVWRPYEGRPGCAGDEADGQAGEPHVH